MSAADVSDRAVALLDGGTGEECFRLGVPDDRRIWSARALVESRYHDIVRQVHERFIRAGARYITSNNYAVTPGTGLDDQLSELSELAGRLADEARERVRGEGIPGVAICGCLPPLIESYRPDLVLPHAQAAAVYQRIARALGERADLLLAETMSSLAEARAAVDGARSVAPDMPVWVSLTLNDQGQVRSGESVVEVARALTAMGIDGLLFNCCLPEAIERALDELAGADDLLVDMRSAGIRLGAYGNRLTPVPADFAMAESTEPQAMRVDLQPAHYARLARRWVERGAQLIGGCCGIGPEHIAELDRQLT